MMLYHDVRCFLYMNEPREMMMLTQPELWKLQREAWGVGFVVGVFSKCGLPKPVFQHLRPFLYSNIIHSFTVCLFVISSMVQICPYCFSYKNLSCMSMEHHSIVFFLLLHEFNLSRSPILMILLKKSELMVYNWNVQLRCGKKRN